MTLPFNFANTLNIIIIAVFALFIVMGYMRGFVSQILDIVSLLASLVLAWLFAPQLASSVPIVPSTLDWFQTPLIGDGLHQIANTVVWYALVFIAVSILMTFVVKPAAKTIHAIPIAKTINRLLGAVFGLIMPFILAMIATFVLSSPLFVNGRSVVEASFLAPITEITDIALDSIYKQTQSGGLIQKVIDGESITTEDFQSIPDWFAKLGLPQELQEPFEKLVNQEALTQEEINTVVEYIKDEGWTKEDVSNFLSKMGLSSQQIDEMINKLGIK